MFDGDLDVQLGGNLMKFCYPKLTVMRGVIHTISLFLNNTPQIKIVNQIITSHKEIYKLSGSGMYHKPDSVFK